MESLRFEILKHRLYICNYHKKTANNNCYTNKAAKEGSLDGWSSIVFVKSFQNLLPLFFTKCFLHVLLCLNSGQQRQVVTPDWCWLVTCHLSSWENSHTILLQVSLHKNTGKNLQVGVSVIVVVMVILLVMLVVMVVVVVRLFCFLQMEIMTESMTNSSSVSLCISIFQNSQKGDF